MKTLKTIQTLAKIGKILSKIVFICSIVGLCLCGVGFLGLVIGGRDIELGSVTLHLLQTTGVNLTLGDVWVAIFVQAFECIGEMIVSKIALDYFKNELEQGTPFHMDGAKELQRLGIYTIWVPIAAAVVGEIALSIVVLLGDHTTQIVHTSIDCDGNISLGIMFLVASLLCRYGAQLQQEKADAQETHEIEETQNG